MITRTLTTLAILLLATGCAAGPTAKYTLTPQESTHHFSLFDVPTPVWAYNGQVPGPTIRAKAGTVLEVDLHNALGEPTSVHWHGLRIDNAMDGVPGVTQDPIQPGQRFTYRLTLKEPGTYWYHPHFNAGEQLERGLKGVLIVDETEPQPWSRELIWLVDDWRMLQDGTIFPRFNTHHDLMHDGRWGNMVTINGVIRPEVAVFPGERIRLRLINGANARVILPNLDGLPATVIAVDGRPVTRHFALQNFPLAPGNRVDLDIIIPVDAGGKTFHVTDRFTQRPFELATIRVEHRKPVVTPSFKAISAPDFLPSDQFRSIEVSKTWDLDAVRGGTFGIGWAMNNRLWPDADTVSQTLGRPQKLRFVNNSTRLHPMHIHGVFFRVLEVNGEAAVEAFTRDTVLIGPRESIVVGFVPEHTGVWLTHCHIQSHAEAGMMTTIDVQKASP